MSDKGDSMIKIKSYKIQKRGIRGFSISVPPVWLLNNGLESGDKVMTFMDEQNRLLLVPLKEVKK